MGHPLGLVQLIKAMVSEAMDVIVDLIKALGVAPKVIGRIESDKRPIAGDNRM